MTLAGSRVREPLTLAYENIILIDTPPEIGRQLRPVSVDERLLELIDDHAYVVDVDRSPLSTWFSIRL